MPVRACKHPTCSAYVPRDGDGYCPEHAAHAKPRADFKAKRAKFYDQHLRDKDAKAFYNSREWKDVRRRKLAEFPVCQCCLRDWSRHVHHEKPLAECTRDESLDPSNLKALCPSCHSTIEADRAAARGSA